MYVFLYYICYLGGRECLWSSRSHHYRVCVFCLMVWKNSLTQHSCWRASLLNVGHRCSFTLSHRAGWRKRKWCRDGRKSALRCFCGFVLSSHCFFLSFMLSPSLLFFLTFLHRFMAVTMTTTSVNYFLSWIAVLLLSPFLSDTFIYARSSFILSLSHSFIF